ncbi:hypothetical protein F0562_025868 [Nyssa sinensis]|uniref:Uncharacterized protein n=1 Tax=Nyssa sinensis TaxID=561372 RepID=A0A5J5B9W6_9ASTE|nr:hypothetical protein F0562_025868 [Nyssa sinensis]
MMEGWGRRCDGGGDVRWCWVMEVQVSSAVVMVSLVWRWLAVVVVGDDGEGVLGDGGRGCGGSVIMEVRWSSAVEWWLLERGWGGDLQKERDGDGGYGVVGDGR